MAEASLFFGKEVLIVDELNNILVSSKVMEQGLSLNYAVEFFKADTFLKYLLVKW